MSDRHQQKPYPLRMPDDLRYKLEIAAQDGNRSLHSEIVSRLEGSLKGFLDKDLTVKMLNDEVNRLTDELRTVRGAGSRSLSRLDDTIEAQVRSVMDATGLDFEDALLLAVTRGSALETSVPVLILQVAKGTALSDVKDLVRGVLEETPEDASLFYEQKDIQSTRRISSPADAAKITSKASQKK